MRHHELRSAFIDSTGGVCEQRFGLTFIAAQTETGKGMPVGAIVHSHDPISVLTKGLQQLNIALNRDFKPTYATVQPSCPLARYFLTVLDVVCIFFSCLSRCWYMDDSDQEIGAVSNVWPGAQIRLCFWHLTEAWKRWLRKNVEDRQLHLDVSDTLRCIAHARKPAELSELQSALLNRLAAARMGKVWTYLFDVTVVFAYCTLCCSRNTEYWYELFIFFICSENIYGDLRAPGRHVAQQRVPVSSQAANVDAGSSRPDAASRIFSWLHK